jgi:anthranilate phosphoribosyltransferase
MREYLKILADGRSLTREEAEGALHVIMRGESEPEETAGFLLGLRARGESVDELVGFTKVMRAYAVRVDAGDGEAIDLCGTGGDSSGTFNISTAAALVCAGAGVTVAKHGNRSVSSACGSADVLEALGVCVELGKEGVEQCLREAGIAFIFAPYFHPAMKHVMPVRRKLGVRTFFNILGPLCNPAGVRRQLVGAFDIETAQTMAHVLEQLEAEHIVTVHAEDGLDEISLACETTVFEYNQASRNGTEEHMRIASTLDERSSGSSRRISPESFGLERASVEHLQGGSAEDNAHILKSILRGDKGPRRDVVVLNAAFALHVSGKFGQIDDCLAAAIESIDSGAAQRRLDILIQASKEPASS